MTTNETTQATTTEEMDGVELLDTLEIKKTTRRPEDQGVWVDGTIDGYQFQALVWPDHASDPDYELADSRITKLWMQRMSDRKMVANFDRGWDSPPKTVKAERIVALLAAGLADHILT